LGAYYIYIDEHFKGTDIARWLRCEDNTLSDPSKFRS
jgi:hypothetical protein